MVAEIFQYLPNEVTSTGLGLVTARLLAAIIVIFVFRQITKKRYKLPPGPTGFPIVGYAPILTGNAPHQTLQTLCKKYGSNVVSFYLGDTLTVVVGDYAAIRELLTKDEFLDRPERNVLRVAVPDPNVTVVNGQVWKEQRRFALQQMRDLGFGKSRLEQHMQEEVMYFLKELQKCGGKPSNLRQLLSISTSNNIRLLMFGHRLDYDDSISIETENCLRKVIDDLGKLQFLYYLSPWVRKLLPFLGMKSPHEEISKAAARLKSFVEKEVAEHEKSFQDGYVRDYVDGFLAEMMKDERQNEQTSFNYDLLHGNSTEFFLAGTDTTRATLSWVFLLLAVHQDIQERAYKEIVDVIGEERVPNWSDRSNLPYCQAVIAEVHRLKTVLPLSVDRTTTNAGTTLQGYDIPKETVILPNIWAIHHDPTYWKNPDHFDPTRFLSEDGKKYVKSERLIPFSIGRRSCPGETMAQVEAFLYFVSILQRFKILPKEGHEIDLDGIFDLIYQPKTVECVYFQQRA